MERQPVAGRQQRCNGNVRQAEAVFGKAKVKSDGGLLVVRLPLDKFDWLSLK